MRPGAPLDYPLTVLSGQSDPQAPEDTLGEWAAHTKARFRTRLFPGGHFFFLDATETVLDFIAQALLAGDRDDPR